MKVLLFRIIELVVESIRILNHSRQKVLFTGRQAQKIAHSTPSHLSRHMFQGAICSDSLGLQPAWACRSTRSFAGRGRSWQDLYVRRGGSLKMRDTRDTRDSLQYPCLWIMISHDEPSNFGVLDFQWFSDKPKWCNTFCFVLRCYPFPVWRSVEIPILIFMAESREDTSSPNPPA